MSRSSRSLVLALGLGQLVGLLGWVDPIFLLLVLAGPPVSGAVAAARGVPCRWIALLWCSAGLCLAWTDWVVNREDVVFHLGLSLVMPALAAGGWAVVRLLTRFTAQGRATRSVHQSSSASPSSRR